MITQKNISIQKSMVYQALSNEEVFCKTMN